MKKVKLNNDDFKSLKSLSDLLENSVLQNAVFDVANDEKMGGIDPPVAGFAKVEPGYAQAVWAQA